MSDQRKKIRSEADERLNDMDNKNDNTDLGYSKFPLCREPWESYYILRRGILPCCYGNPIVAPMKDWKEAWNSPEIQEIRRYLSQGKLSPYCRESLGCPIVQRVLAEERKKQGQSGFINPRRPFFLRVINRIFWHLPARIYNFLKKKDNP
ncbi:MAG: SPASM domain-containing protein [Candidatus Aminicenantes bacterium]|nr:SPASM domain-containing protein [Candidatus Aminicenantes bacterium]